MTNELVFFRPLDKPYLTDRSRIVKRADCRRARYLNYDFDIDGEMVGIQRRAPACRCSTASKSTRPMPS
jgi:hypothetical protein